MANGNKIAKTVIILLIVAFLAFAIAGAVFLTTERPWLFKGLQHDETSGKMETRTMNEDFSFPLEDVEKINAKTVNTNISIIPVDSGEIRVHYHGTYTGNIVITPIIGLVNGQLKAWEEHNRTLFNLRITQSDLKLDIYVPEAYLGDLKAETVSGNIDMESVNPHNLECHTVSGDINLDTVAVNIAKFNTVSGKITLDGFEGGITATSVSGDILGNLDGFTGNIIINTVSGRTGLNLPETAGFNLYTNSVSGMIECDFPMSVTKSGAKNSLTGTVGAGDHKIDITSVSGGISIMMRQS